MANIVNAYDAQRLRQWNQELARRNAALEKGIRMTKTGSCWCQMGIGNPMVHGHSNVCKYIRGLMGEEDV